jgi:hypothetical protein
MPYQGTLVAPPPAQSGAAPPLELQAMSTITEKRGMSNMPGNLA